MRIKDISQEIVVDNYRGMRSCKCQRAFFTKQVIRWLGQVMKTSFARILFLRECFGIREVGKGHSAY